MRKWINSVRQLLQRSARIAKEEKYLFFLFVVLSVAGALTEGVGVSLLAPILEPSNSGSGFANIPILGWMMEQFNFQSYSERVKAAALSLLVVALVRGVLLYSVDAIGRIVPLRLRQRISLQSHLHLLGAPMDTVNRTDIGELASYVLNIPGRIATALTAIAQMISNILILLVYLALMIVVSWQMSIAAFFFMAAMSLILWKLSFGPIRRTGAELNKTQSDVNQAAYEAIDSTKLIRLMNYQSNSLAKMKEAQKKFTDGEIKLGLIGALPHSILTAGAGIFICLLLYGAASLAPEESDDWAPVILLFLFLTFRLLGPVSQINQARNTIAGQVPAFDLLAKFFAFCEANQLESGSKKFDHLRESIRFENVHFSYPMENGTLLKDLNFSIDKGRRLALVGPSGAGKSTITALLARFYDLDSGQILVDGTPLNEYDIQSWRARIAVVSQDIAIFNATAAENLRVGKPDANDAELWDALKLAAADDFVKQLPNGLETVLGDRGVRLSGGQQQRIAIARAILRNPDFLILDEATSQLDTVTEAAIQNAIDHLAKDRTVLIIAHRLSTIRNADSIIVLENGGVSEQGSHEVLIERKGAYWNLLKHQQLDLVCYPEDELKLSPSA